MTESLSHGGDLTPEEVRAATESLLDESYPNVEKADFLSALAQKGETPAEIAAFASEFLDRAVDPELDFEKLGKPVIDVCGTGGSGLDIFNVSTTSVFILAAAGVAVAKHGNRGITSKSGGADALEALGIRIDLPPEDFRRCVEQVGAGFLFAPNYHPAFKAVVPVRKLLAERGQRTIFNILGPLLNPTRPDYQLVGIFDPEIGPAYADILNRLGRKRAWVVHGTTDDRRGMDEVSTIGPTRIWSTDGTDSIEPGSLGFGPATLTDIQGGGAEENAEQITAILDGREKGPLRDIVVLNAAAALAVSGKVGDLPEGISLASETLDSGAAREVLERWRNFS